MIDERDRYIAIRHAILDPGRVCERRCWFTFEESDVDWQARAVVRALANSGADLGLSTDTGLPDGDRLGP